MEARRMITPYVRGELPERDLEQFLKHIEQCGDCMDELDIYFTVYMAMDLLDTGEKHEYDFKKMLHDSIRISKTRIVFGRVRRFGRGILIFCAELLLIISIVTGIQVKLGREETSVFHRVMLHFRPLPEKIAEKESELQSKEGLAEQIQSLVRERNRSLRENSLQEKETGQKDETALPAPESSE